MKQNKDKLIIWQKDFDMLLKLGKKIGKAWAVKRGIDLRKLSEEEKYNLVAKNLLNYE